MGMRIPGKFGREARTYLNLPHYDREKDKALRQQVTPLAQSFSGRALLFLWGFQGRLVYTA